MKLTCGFLQATAALALALAFAPPGNERRIPKDGYREWKVYGGSPESIRYSTLDQINPHNVSRLRIAWIYDTGDATEGSEMECNPIVVRGVVYATSPQLRVIALDAATGKLLWSFTPLAETGGPGKSRNRGVTYWEDGEDRRIFVVALQWLYALDAVTGKPVTAFGEKGRVDLRQGLGRDPETTAVSANTPGIIYKDMLILGNHDSEDLPSAPGDIRAYDVRTGKLRWSFHTIPYPGEFGYETWPKDAWKYSGSANCWGGMAVDEKRGLVFAPTGSAAFDFYGANRIGDDLFANTLLVLKADTGERVWHFQFVKHDVWDRDVPAPPNLVTVKRDGRLIDAVSQITKTGHVFVFDRETGQPLFPIEYRNVPKSDVDGEVLSEIQPIPLKPPPFARQVFTEYIVTRRTPEAHKVVLDRLGTLRRGHTYEPPSLQGTVVFPGFDGGGEWGGAAFDPETGLLYVNSNEMAWVLRLVERSRVNGKLSGRSLYARNCANCHRDDRKGTPPEFPSLVDVGEKRSESQMEEIINRGRGRMPGFFYLKSEAIRAIARFLKYGEDAKVSEVGELPAPMRLKYYHDGYNRFLDPDGYPAIEPPWGTLNAISLDTGEIAWKIPFGEFPELVEKGIRNTGSENYGGPVVTAGGLLFIGATDYDRKFHAFNKATGEVLWETTLPAAGTATPAVYEVDGRQFVLIGCGGGKSGRSSGGSYVAFALPQ
jgi:quinoprotein glucose dehydrogenase